MLRGRWGSGLARRGRGVRRPRRRRLLRGGGCGLGGGRPWLGCRLRLRRDGRLRGGLGIAIVIGRGGWVGKLGRNAAPLRRLEWTSWCRRRLLLGLFFILLCPTLLRGYLDYEEWLFKIFQQPGIFRKRWLCSSITWRIRRCPNSNLVYSKVYRSRFPKAILHLF